MTDLSGHVAIVTGATGGIGSACVRLMLDRGAKVLATDIHVDAETFAEGSDCRPMQHDVTDADAWTKIVAAAVDSFGSVSILVNNAGISQLATPIQACTDEDYRRVVEVNQFGVFYGMKAVVEPMRSRGGGAIVNMSSAVGLVGSPGAIAYVASKFAVAGMTKAAALDLAAFGIRVNSVHPGLVATPMTQRATDAGFGRVEDWVAHLPIPRPATPIEIAEMVAFLASDAASFCTGGNYPVDGGMTAA